MTGSKSANKASQSTTEVYDFGVFNDDDFREMQLQRLYGDLFRIYTAEVSA